MKNDELPSWADAALSKDLFRLRQQGESQSLEFKRELQKQRDDIAKEIAAFATSGAGVLLLGVGDDGALLGLSDAKTPEGRDRLFQTIEAICSDTIEPALTPTVSFVIESDLVVMAIQVAKGSEPVYYAKGRPMIRHLTASKIARPSEVIALIRVWLESTQGRKALASQAFYKRAIEALALSQIAIKVMPDRDCNPWLEANEIQIESCSERMRELSHADIASDSNLRDSLVSISDDLDTCAQTCRGWDWKECLESLVPCQAKLDTFSETLVEHQELFSSDEFDVERRVVELKRKLQDMLRRAPKLMEQDRLEDLQREGPELGRQILMLVFHPLAGDTETNMEAERIGLALDLLETAQTYADGGQSYRKIADDICALAREFISLGAIEFSKAKSEGKAWPSIANVTGIGAGH